MPPVISASLLTAPRMRGVTVIREEGITCAYNYRVAVLLWIGQWIWRWTDGGFPSFPPLDYEGRISEVESSLKKTAKALQLQWEVVDVKIRLEVDALKKGLQRVEERDAMLGTEMKQLGDRADQLSRIIHELKDGRVLSKAEFETLLDEFKRGGLRALEGSIRALVHLG